MSLKVAEEWYIGRVNKILLFSNLHGDRGGGGRITLFGTETFCPSLKHEIIRSVGR